MQIETFVLQNEMGEQDALVFLANVALHSQVVPSPIYHRRKDSRPKELKIIHLNGSNIAEINDLKNIPMSVLFKIFIEKFEDTSRHCTVYVCKFGFRNGCNTKFMDIKENRIHRLEHLIQCHLLEHLLKTKSGSFIEIPKKSLENMKTNKFSRSMTEIDNSRSNCSIPRIIQNVVKNEDSDTCTIQKNARKNIRPNNDEAKTTATLTDLTKNDHTYAAFEEKKSSNVTNWPEECSFIKSDDVGISRLVSPSGQCSEELSSFMMYETLHQPTNIFIIDGTNLIVEQLPIVGSEVEVQTNCDVNLTKNFITCTDKIHYTCTFCSSSYLTKKSLNLHIRKKHTGIQSLCRLKTIKRKIVPNEDELLRHNSKEIKATQMAQPSENINNNWLVELKENLKDNVNPSERNTVSILKTALTMNQDVKRPVINISNVWNNIHVQYV